MDHELEVDIVDIMTFELWAKNKFVSVSKSSSSTMDPSSIDHVRSHNPLKRASPLNRGQNCPYSGCRWWTCRGTHWRIVKSMPGLGLEEKTHKKEVGWRGPWAVAVTGRTGESSDGEFCVHTFFSLCSIDLVLTSLWSSIWSDAHVVQNGILS
jgi:hypothetical protein